MAVVAAAVAVLLAASGAGPAVDRFPDAAPSYLVAVDGEVLWERAPDAPRPPASLAKILAALVVLEDPPEAGWLRVGARAAAETGSRIGLRSGEEIRVADALAAMLVASANDACRALAEREPGGSTAFVSRMNRRATALGLRATRIVDPCGHDARGQRTTARDLLVLTRAALASAEFRRIVALPEVRLSTRAGRVLAAPTSNALLGRLPGADGVKTGFTPQAGKCVVASARRDGREVLVVLLGAPDRWWTAAALVERAFAEAPPRG
ncbi:MAG TPA: serine hydrolase [Anaeromyxobacteraceae bacterium]|nr:serine hydrolase [Anaeromyxobacteraceae bacterium]